MKKLLLIMILCLLGPGLSQAHFAMLLPDPPQLDGGQPAALNLDLSFCHPRTGQGMDMEKPVSFGLWHAGRQQNLLPALEAQTHNNGKAWRARYQITSPGDHIFYATPAPYWEETEKLFIVHHTKVVFNAYDKQDTWDRPIGLPMEIVPLTRPYGLYPGNSFSGVVLLQGKPLPNCEVEVEYYDRDSQYPAAHDSLITQVVKTNGLGYFTFSFPWPGWWGMAALHDSAPITYNHKTAPLEIGGVLWVYVNELP